MFRSTPEYWDSAALEHEAGREQFPPCHGHRWRTHGQQSVGIEDLGELGGRTLVEIGCGDGAVLRALAQSFPTARFVGLDFSDQQLRLARLQTADLENVVLNQIDVRYTDVLDLGPFDEVLSVYGAPDFVEDVGPLIDRLLPAMSKTGVFSFLTSKSDVLRTLTHHSKLQGLTVQSLGSSWFVRAVRST